MTIYIERQSDQRHDESAITHWIYGEAAREALSLSVDEVRPEDVETSRPITPGYTPAILFQGVYYFLTPAPRQIATGLSESGRRALAEFLAAHLSDLALSHLIAAYEADITFDINDSLAGHLEVSGMHTCDGNPAVRIFDGADVILEDVEVED
jgi:hypothetical protein